MHVRHPKVVDAASGEEEPSGKVCEVADAPPSLKSNISKKIETKYSLTSLFFVYLVTFKVQSWLNKGPLNFFFKPLPFLFAQFLNFTINIVQSDI